MNLQMKRLTLSGVLFRELATSRRPLQRWNDPSGQMMQLFDTENQVLYVVPKSELFESAEPEGDGSKVPPQEANTD